MNDNNIYRRKLGLLIGLFFLLISIGVAAYIFLDNCPDDRYELLCTAPFLFSILTIIGINAYNRFFESLSLSILVSGFFIKLVIYPLCFSLGGYSSFYRTGYFQNNCLQAILFLASEYLMILLATRLFSKKYSAWRDNNIEYEIKPGGTKTHLFIFLLIILVLFIFFAFKTIPAIQTIYYPFWKININMAADIRWDNETIVARGGIQRYIYSLFAFIFPIVRLVVPILLIYKVYSIFGSNRTSIVISSFCLLLPFVILGGDNLAPFICSLFGLILISKLYKERAKPLIITLGIIGLVGVISVAITKIYAFTLLSGAEGISAIAQIINAYFPGIDNVSIAMSMECTDRGKILINEILAAIPFSGTIFGNIGDNVYDIFTTSSGVNSQIVEWGTNIGFFASNYLSLLITLWLVYFVQKMELNSRYTSDFWEYFILKYFSLFTAISVIMYSSYIYIRFLFSVLIPILVLLTISGAKHKKYFFDGG